MSCLSGSAFATVPDRYGLGARWQGRGGGSVALVDDGTAAFVNPAGLAAADAGQVSLGLLGASPRVEAVPAVWWDTNRDGVVDERDPPLLVDPTPPGVFGLDLAVLGRLGDRAALGATVWLPTAAIVRFQTFEPDLPSYARWGNRTQRANVAFGLGIDTVGGLQLGASLDMGVKARATVRLTLDATARPGGTGTGTSAGIDGDLVYDVHQIDLSVVPTAAPVVGLRWEVGEAIPALDGLALGARYHAPTGMPLDVVIDAQANVGVEELADDPYVAALVGVSELSLFDHDVPQRLDLGAGLDRGPLAVHLDARWTDWRAYRLSIARVVDAELTAPLVDLGDVVLDGNEVAYEVRATWDLRGGVEVRLPEVPAGARWRFVQGALRAGAAYDPTPLVSVGSSAILDSDHRVLTAGVGLSTGQPFDPEGVLSLDLSAQHHGLARGVLPRTSASPRAGYPVQGSGVPFGGGWWAVGGQLSVAY